MTTSNIEGRFNGWIDESITQKQALELENCDFQTHVYDVIYCSPMKRCIETARALGIENVIAEPRLIERNLGIFEEKTLRECETLYAADIIKFKRLDGDYSMPGGESRSQNLDRVLSWLEDVRGFNRILAITHGGPIDFIYRIACGKDLHGGETIYAGHNAHISIFNQVNESWSVTQFSQPIT